MTLQDKETEPRSRPTLAIAQQYNTMVYLRHAKRRKKRKAANEND